MRTRSLVVILLILVLTVSLAACGGTLPVEGLTTPPQGGDGSDAPATQAAPAITAAPEPVIPVVQGADSVKTLLEKSLEYFHSGRDYSKIAEVHDEQAYLAWFLMEELYRGEDLSLDEAREKAALLFEDAETLRAKDPELAELVMDGMDAEEPEEFLSDYMNELRDALRNGEIPTDAPDYGHVSDLLADWDKGADYVFEHYPELLEDAEEANLAIGLDGALKLMHKFARFEVYNADLDRFAALESEYRPENTYVDASGICSYDMGSVQEGYEVWSIDMMYCVRDGVYYLIGYSPVLGTAGG